MMFAECHEIALYLESLSAADVANLPAGQRDVLISKITDVVGSNEPNLEFPSERFLQLMLTRGVFLPRDDYRDIVAPGIEWAFERYFGSRLGKVTLRDAIEEAAFISRGDAHKVLMEEFTKSFERSQLDTKEGWFLHAVREVIIALMANPSCTESSPVLKDGLKQVNRLQRARE